MVTISNIITDCGLAEQQDGWVGCVQAGQGCGSHVMWPQPAAVQQHVVHKTSHGVS